MESSSSSSPTKHVSKVSLFEKQQKCMANMFGSNCMILLSPPFPHSPFSPAQSFKPNLLQSPQHIVRNFHNSIVSTADNCLTLLRAFVSQNPALSKIFSLPSDFQNFCQINRRNCRSLSSLRNHNFAAILPGDSVAGLVVANGISNFLNLYNTVLVVRLVLTWFPNSPPAIVGPLSTLCDPYLNIFRGIIPPLGGTLDLSPILAFLVLNVFTSSAAALPAELPPAGLSREIQSSCNTENHLTTTQKKWRRRLMGNKPNNSRKEN